MNNFIYENKTKVYFGKGCMKEYLTSILRGYSRNVLLAYGGGSVKRNGVYDEVMGYLSDAGKTVTEFSGIMSNPTYEKVQEGAKLARENEVNLILAVGGGSVIDCCKIVSAQAKTERDIWEMEFDCRTYPTEFIPMIAIVTASGTGAEMNNGAVITNEERKLKAGMLGAQADIAMIDPTYALSLPMRQVLSGAFDTLSHCMETYFGKPGSGNLSDEINETIMRLVIRNIRVLLKDEGNMNARSELAWASSMAENGILKIGKVTDFECHQMEHQLGAYTDCNHGAGLAVLHPVYYRHIYQSGLPKFARFAEVVWGISSEDKTEEELAKSGIEALASFIREIGLPTTLRELGVNEDTDLKAIADSCNCVAGAYKKMTHEEILEIFKECY
ncbi:MAG: iron-containing alcohol dehydrogenase [Oscillospiraceae bacterium]|nr:iron-containing alcohol dehydrogenase [Oscillospiraceae bacterium]